MFTGIIELQGRVRNISSGRLIIESGFEGLAVGESISVNGVCLTVAEITSGNRGTVVFRADVSPETLRITGIGKLKRDKKVNLERALKSGDRFGGHVVTGHIDGTGEVKSVKNRAGFRVIEIAVPRELIKGLVRKGSVAVDGISLTVVDFLPAGIFTVSVIPHTADTTTLGIKKSGDTVNIELDVLGKYAQQVQEEKESRITETLLKEKGFV